ncbi:MAG TPA: hypothetical protein PLL30_12465 [Candidatus Krumholzibacteria bacterium]|nr:hypothetical protein [Candidatus Krumholzibacteria bacterium]HPD72582.1 hypothetical protein [Candidatus Krumholzibacteria bacterium]HRY40486.1 hypothetical protein [Candidatus Krumholzibacteria bacterium]
MRRFPKVLASLACLMAPAGLAIPAGSLAQDAILEKQAAVIVVRVVDATSGESVRAERVLVREVGALMPAVAESTDVEGEVRFENQGVFNFKPYIVSAWVDGVGYHIQRTGQTFLDGEPAVVRVFEQTDLLEGLVATGMNVVVRSRERGYELEYVVTVDNQSRPQRTLRGSALPVRVALPASIGEIEVEVDNGPDPLTAELRPTEDGLMGVAASLTPGEARITIRGLLPPGSRTEFAVATNLAVDQWSLLAWPADLDVRSVALTLDRDNTYPEFSRWLGRPLGAGERVDVTVSGPERAGAVRDPATVAGPAPERLDGPQPGRRRTFPWATVIAAVVLLGAYAMWRLRR